MATLSFQYSFRFRRMMGGLVITASGLVFGSGGEDNRMWAYDVDTGEELWHSDPMEHEATAVPMTYRTDGRQFIVVNVGGHFTLPGRADVIQAFTLKTDQSTTVDASGTTDSPVGGVANKPLLNWLSVVTLICLFLCHY